MRRAGRDDALLEIVGEARLVLLGVSSHGTHEFHRARAEITKRLIAERGFGGVAVDADASDAWRVDRFVRGVPGDEDAADALGGFWRFPSWVFRNTDVLEFVSWLRERNDGLGAPAQAGFYGLDLYGLHGPVEAAVEVLRRVDPDAARRAEARHACFDRFGGDAQGYAACAMFGLGVSCEDDVVERLVGTLSRGGRIRVQGREVEDPFFAAEKARLGKGAARYYRAMFGSPVVPWSLRDSHMAETLDALAHHLSRGGEEGRLVVWGHSVHVGDARATEMGDRGESSLGQLVRQRHGADALLVGFTTGAGTVTAAQGWAGPARRWHLRPAPEGSYEDLFRGLQHPRFLLDLRGELAREGALSARRLERAIGAVYRPETERRSHTFSACLPGQFDAVVHVDRARAAEPLELTSLWLRGEPLAGPSPIY